MAQENLCLLGVELSTAAVKLFESSSLDNYIVNTKIINAL